MLWQRAATARALLEAGADATSNKALLVCAARVGFAEGVALLLGRPGADAEAAIEGDVTALHGAIFAGSARVCRLLVAAGADCTRIRVRRHLRPHAVTLTRCPPPAHERALHRTGPNSPLRFLNARRSSPHPRWRWRAPSPCLQCWKRSRPPRG